MSNDVTMLLTRITVALIVIIYCLEVIFVATMEENYCQCRNCIHYIRVISPMLKVKTFKFIFCKSQKILKLSLRNVYELPKSQ